MTKPIAQLFLQAKKDEEVTPFLRKEFEKEFARLETLMADLTTRAGVVRTLEDAQAEAAHLREEAEKMRGQVEKRAKAVEARILAADRKEKELYQRESAIQEKESYASKRLTEVREAEMALGLRKTQAEREWADREHGLAILQEGLNAREAALEARVKKLSALLYQIQSLEG